MIWSRSLATLLASLVCCSSPLPADTAATGASTHGNAPKATPVAVCCVVRPLISPPLGGLRLGRDGSCTDGSWGRLGAAGGVIEGAWGLLLLVVATACCCLVCSASFCGLLSSLSKRSRLLVVGVGEGGAEGASCSCCCLEANRPRPNGDLAGSLSFLASVFLGSGVGFLPSSLSSMLLSTSPKSMSSDAERRVSEGGLLGCVDESGCMCMCVCEGRVGGRKALEVLMMQRDRKSGGRAADDAATMLCCLPAACRK
mmetsp:Transcript_9056/g.26039  ORF Transcript_9056/g.26039 Transcript_9056/m.26039 type:complete len:256 (-) Transcript_9056:79-846(-)